MSFNNDYQMQKIQKSDARQQEQFASLQRMAQSQQRQSRRTSYPLRMIGAIISFFKRLLIHPIIDMRNEHTEHFPSFDFNELQDGEHTTA